MKASPQLNPYRPKFGITPKITDAELITVSVMQALRGYHNVSRWIRYARNSLIHLFPDLPKQPGYNKRLRRLTTQLTYLIAVLVTDTDLWQHPIRIADSTPVPCGMSRETALRSDLDCWAVYGYCASHSRLFWGLRLHLVTTVHGLPVAFALSNAKTNEREVLVDLVTLQPSMFHHPDGLILVADKGYRDRDTETWLNDRGITVIRPAYRTEPERPGRGLLRAVRQSIESVNQTFKGQLDLEHHGGRTITGVAVRILQRVLAADRGDRAQLAHRPTSPTVTGRLRPLTPWNRSSRPLGGGLRGPCRARLPPGA
ncbi:IS982 family transposase [Micromonospora sp. NPDC005203]|uniref:IS982 family transposase n=1 Tax=Micromonospora sp. NPDC005203 TaxID=3364226 RepID=UPI0036C83F74